MSLWVCDPDRGGCTTRYSVGAPRCPHCGQTAAYELGDEQHRNVRDTDAEQEADQLAEPPAGDGETAAAEETAGVPAARPARASRTHRARG
jgi:predicted  nucleic acid-binding Zn-ribbon protein